MEGSLLGSYIDTDVILRLITGDDLQKQEDAAKLFEKVIEGDLMLSTPDTAIADAVFILSSTKHYNLPRSEIRDALCALIRYSNFKVDNKQAVLTALDIYGDHNIDFGDAMLIALTNQTDSKEIYSYDHDFDKFPDIIRKEP